MTIAVSATIAIGGIGIALGEGSAGGAAKPGSGPVGREGQPTEDVSTADVQVKVKRTTVTLSTNGYGGLYLGPQFDNNCASHSYGQVQGFFRSNPCKWLARAYIVVRENNKDLAVVAISWVDMPSRTLALKYKSMVDKPGTGNITELSRETGQYQKVIFNGDIYMSDIVGTSVWNVQVQPIGQASPDILTKILHDARQ